MTILYIDGGIQTMKWEILKHMAIELFPMDLERQKQFIERGINPDGC